MLDIYGEKIRRDFIDRTRPSSNLQEWEKTILKTFSRYKNIFAKNKAQFSLHSNSRSNLTNYDESMGFVDNSFDSHQRLGGEVVGEI